ncbi:MAG: DUF4410 domain-containing protein [Candidatus Binataceae bacterium]|nr:DUF4410 domain-containing protein [Candidatus Binataceae bacterium]
MRVSALVSSRFIPGQLALAGILFLGGCTPANISPGRTARPAIVRRPTQIVVHEFAVSPAELAKDRRVLSHAHRAAIRKQEQLQRNEVQLAHEAAKALADDLVKELTPLGFKVRVIPRGTAVPESALVIDGQFVDVDEGSRLRRLVIGFGAGASKLDTRVEVTQATGGEPKQLLSFATHADSGKMPGAAVTMGAGVAVAGGLTAATMLTSGGMAGVKTYLSTIDSLADSTSKQIAAYFSQYAAKQKWIRQDQVQQVDYASPK